VKSAESAGESVFEIDSAFSRQGRIGKGAGRAVEQGRPNAMAFVDWRMAAGWDGIETIGHIWRTYPELQVVICTAYSDYSGERSLDAGRGDKSAHPQEPFDNIEVLQLGPRPDEEVAAEPAAGSNSRLGQNWSASHRRVQTANRKNRGGNGRAQTG